MIPMGLSQRQQSAGYDFIIQNTAHDKNNHTNYAKRQKTNAANLEADEQRNAGFLE